MQAIDPSFLGRLYRQHAPALRLYARQWGQSGEDLVQSAFVRLAQQAPPPEQVLPWLYRVVRNEALAAHRAAARRRQREQRASPPEGWFSAADDHLDSDHATQLLSQLPLELREVIGCSLPTAHRRYQTGLAQLRERLEGRWTRTPTT